VGKAADLILPQVLELAGSAEDTPELAGVLDRD
jgi:hypothetical protein